MTGSAPRPCEATKPTACTGLRALKIAGRSPACRSPSSASTTNQTSVTGPNSTETLAVPRLCTQNSATMIATVIGMT